MPDDIAPRVIQCIATCQRIPPETIRVESTFVELNIDSLDGINILFALENEFGLNIPDDAAKNIKTVNDLVEGLRQLIASEPIK